MAGPGFVSGHNRNTPSFSRNDDSPYMGNSSTSIANQNPRTPSQNQTNSKGLMRSLSSKVYNGAVQSKNAVSQQIDSSLNSIDTARKGSFDRLKLDYRQLLYAFKDPAQNNRLMLLSTQNNKVLQISAQALELGHFARTLATFAGVNYGGFVLKHAIALTTAAISISIINMLKGSQVLAIRKPILNVEALTPRLPPQITGVSQYKVIISETAGNTSIGLTATHSLKRSVSHYSKAGRRNQAEQRVAAEQTELKFLVGKVQQDMQNKLFKSDDEARVYMNQSLNRHMRSHEIKVALSGHILVLPLLLAVELKNLKRQQKTGKISINDEEFDRRDKNELQYQSSQNRQQRINQTQEELSKIKDQLNKTQNQFSKTKNQLNNTKNQLNNTKNQLAETKNRLEIQQKNANTFYSNLTDKNVKISDLESKIKELNNIIEMVRNKLISPEEVLASKTVSDNTLLARLENAIIQNKSTNAEIFNLESLQAELIQEKDSIQILYNKLQAQFNHTNEYVQILHSQLYEKNKVIIELTSALDFCESEIQDLTQYQSQLEIQLHQTENKAKKMHFTILDMKHQIEDLSQQKKQLTIDLRAAKSNINCLTEIVNQSPVPSPKRSLLNGEPISPRTPQQRDRDASSSHNRTKTYITIINEKDALLRTKDTVIENQSLKNNELQQENDKLRKEIELQREELSPKAAAFDLNLWAAQTPDMANSRPVSFNPDYKFP